MTDLLQQENIKKIQAINHDTIHRICSGQVVLSLAVAVKELLENSIDAGATNIEIRLKECGSEFIEISDNGTGVEESNFENLTLKHFTSKLREFTDLDSITTLGFRGEALNSLCALSNLNIVTRHKSSKYATKIEYDSNGHIKSKTICARPIGTTVMLTNIFASLPVRYKEFINNLKREFTKMCQLLHAYSLISTGIRITCTNQTGSTKTTVVSTQANNKLKDNIACIFGFKQFNNLIEFKLYPPTEHILEDYKLNWTANEPLGFIFDGYISKCSHGSGRNTTDRQFYYINSRPCEPKKCMKLVNEVYKYFNGHQYPFVYLNIKTDQSHVDVNITPDKRQVLLQKENLLLATLKTSLLEIYKDFPSMIKVENVNILQNPLKEWSKEKEKFLLDKNFRGKKRTTNELSKPLGNMFGVTYKKRLKIDKKKCATDNSAGETEKQMNKFIKKSVSFSDSETKNLSVNMDAELNKSLRDFKYHCNKFYNITAQKHTEQSTSNYKINSETNNLFENNKQNNDYSYNNSNYNIEIIEPLKPEKLNNSNVEHNLNENIKTNISNNLDYKISLKETASLKTSPKQFEKNESVPSTSKIIELNNKINDENTDSANKKIIVDVSIDDIKMIINKRKLENCNNENLMNIVKFRSEIDGENAELELQKHITSDIFEQMEIIGQFNKGFIITKYDSDIFIIDQHATDEKYNFEMLQRTTTLQNQKLVSPKPLQLTATNEMLLIEHLDVFKNNGFTFNIDNSAEAGKKIYLTSIPVSKNWHFGKEDIDELLLMLREDSSVENIRPSRIKAMFASRACRQSVMVGQSLGIVDMRKIVDHMAEIEQPWNCPHGRPTMRHLVNLNFLDETIE